MTVHLKKKKKTSFVPQFIQNISWNLISSLQSLCDETKWVSGALLLKGWADINCRRASVLLWDDGHGFCAQWSEMENIFYHSFIGLMRILFFFFLLLLKTKCVIIKWDTNPHFVFVFCAPSGVWINAVSDLEPVWQDVFLAVSIYHCELWMLNKN